MDSDKSTVQPFDRVPESLSGTGTEPNARWYPRQQFTALTTEETSGILPKRSMPSDAKQSGSRYCSVAFGKLPKGTPVWVSAWGTNPSEPEYVIQPSGDLTSPFTGTSQSRLTPASFVFTTRDIVTNSPEYGTIFLDDVTPLNPSAETLHPDDPDWEPRQTYLGNVTILNSAQPSRNTVGVTATQHR